jgi:tRNA dimethylallyltransferase
MHYPRPVSPARVPLVVVVGPTGAGKTALSLAVAERTGGEIVSADSQQVYRGMDLGTGKVDAATRARIPHHLIDILEPDQQMTAARFIELADAAIAGIAGRDRPVVVAGGTMLYVRALLLGLFEGPPADPAVRARLEAEPDTAALWHRLAAVDPELTARVDRNDRKRIVRALEVHELTGVPMSEHQRRHDFSRVPPRYPVRLVGLAPERELLYRRIDARVRDMMARGLLDEVRALRAAGYDLRHRSQSAIGYAELHRHLDGALSLDDAVRLIQRNSRRYARRQLSWYRGDARVQWYAGAADVDLGELERYLQASQDPPSWPASN